jgi:hypothetical protein
MYDSWFERKSYVVEKISFCLLTLGFIGTILGIIIGLQNFSTDMFTDALKMQKFIETMFVGFSIEITTLLLSAIAKFYLDVVLIFFKKHLMDRMHEE